MMNIYNKVFIIVIIVFLTAFFLIPSQIHVDAVSNETLSFESITSQDGLSQNIVSCIIQDHYGYMWFGTMVGLNKYDGIDFETFLNGPLNANYNYSSHILSLCEASDGCIWIGTDYGLNVYYPATGALTNYEDYFNNMISHDNSVRAIYEDSQGKVWVGTDYGLSIYHPEMDTFTSYQHDSNDPDSISDNSVRAIYEDSQGRLWIGTDNGLNVYHPETDTFTAYKYNSENPDSISDNFIMVIYEDSRGMLWIGTGDGLNVYDTETDTFIAYRYNSESPDSISDNYVTSICEDNCGDLWIGTRKGLDRLDIETMTFDIYRFDASNSNGINSDSILSLCRDADGIIWIGTACGINKLNLNEQAFKYYGGVLLSSPVSGVLNAGDGNLWLQIGEDLVLFNIASGEILDTYSDIGGQNYGSTMNNICLGADGSIWIGTFNSGLRNFNPITNKLTVYVNEPGNEKSLLSNYITSLCLDYEGILWVGTQSGLCSYDSETQEFTQYKNALGYPDLIKNNLIHALYEDPDHNIWFGMDSDVLMMDNETGQIEVVVSELDFDSSPDEYRIYTIYRDSSGLLWIGKGYGLYCYDIEKDELISYYDADSMPHDLVLGTIEDNDGDVWITTRQGLWRFFPEDNTLKRYGLEDGLESDIFYKGAIYKAEDGELFFGTMGGLISFYPDDIVKDLTSPTLVIDGFSVIGGEIFFEESIEDVEDITLPYSDNSFEIDFVALNYSAPDQIQYAYILDGFDENWNYCSAGESFTKYTNIPSGQYTFKVKAASSDGVWNDKGVSLRITISTPFWQEWWFLLLLIAVALLAVFLVIKMRTHSLTRHTQELEMQVARRTSQLAQKSAQLEGELNRRAEFTRALVHELKTPLTSLQVANDLFIEESRGYSNFFKIASIIDHSVNKLSQRTNELLDISRGEIGLLKLKKRKVNLNEFFKDIENEIEILARDKGKNLECNIQIDLPDAIFDDGRISQVIQNLIDNAFKFTTRKDRIYFSVITEDDNLKVSVSDTGRGISKEHQSAIFERSKNNVSTVDGYAQRFSGLGVGLVLSKMIITLHDGQIWVDSERGKGSIFTFTIPIRRS
jgi:ligand-binding sensor domain-containing protein/signal transduction histidine kinase